MSDEREYLPGAEEDRTKKFAVSTTEATADEFKKLAEAVGLNQKDLFASMIDLYKANNAVTGVNKVKEGFKPAPKAGGGDICCGGQRAGGLPGRIPTDNSIFGPGEC